MRMPALAGAVVLVAGSGLMGYVLGESSAPSDAEAERARAAAHGAALTEAKKEAATVAQRRGHRRGLARGRRAGTRAGRLAGKRDGATQAEQELVAAAPAPTPDPLVCDGAIADDEHYQACLEQSEGSAPPVPGNIPPDAPSTCPPGYHFPPAGGDACVPD
jgi:hypothetical protein